MEPIDQHSGLVAPLDRVNVDTDQMIPKQFCKLLTRDGYGKLLFYDWRYREDGSANPEFVLNQPRYQGATILLARDNFGCGSSREHAPWGVLDYGFRVVIAPSYADIFYNNCFKNGILPVTLPSSQVDELFHHAESENGYRLSVDLTKQTVSDNNGLLVHFEIDPYRKEILLKGLDDIGLTLEHETEISAFEKAHSVVPQMFEPVDLYKP